jgi:hypothetical protein
LLLPDKAFLAILDFPVDGKANIRGGEPVEMKIKLEKEAAN